MRLRLMTVSAGGVCGIFAAVNGCVGDTAAPPDSGSDATLDSAADSAPDVVSGDGGDAGPWTPAVLDQAGELALWLEASASNLVISSGQVGTWTDLSKNHNDVINAQGGPSVDPGVVNGHDAVHFDTHGVTLVAADAPSLRFAADQFLMVAVAKESTRGLYFFSKATVHTGVTGQSFFSGVEFYGDQGTVDGGDGGLVLYPAAHIAADTLDSGTAVNDPAAWNGSVFDDGQFHIVELRRPNAGSLTLVVDDQTPQTTSVGGFDVSQAGNGVRIGSVAYGTVTPPMNGELAELIVVHAAVVADSVETSVHAYLKTKYGL
jgi:hypothetical protein